VTTSEPAVPLGFARVEPLHGRRRFEPHRPRISQRYPVGGPILGDVPNLEAARHGRCSILVGATGSKSPHADIPKGQGSSERCHLVGNLHLEGATFAWKVSCPTEDCEDRGR
jgi:hypothetical protein